MSDNLDESELRIMLPTLQRFSYFLTRDSERAADLVQDTIERALKKEHLFDGSNLKGWLMAICRRVFLNGLRHAKTRGVTVDIDSAVGERLTVAPSQETHMQLKEVAAAFLLMTPNDKQLISLIAIEGRSYKDVAASVGIPIGTVRSRLSRARGHLSEAVERRNARSAAPLPKSVSFIA